jgi:hypothetical protein
MPVTDDSLLPFSLPNVRGKKVTTAADSSTISSDEGMFLLVSADKRLGLIEAIAERFPDDRDPTQINHSIAEMLRARVRHCVRLRGPQRFRQIARRPRIQDG